MENNQLIKVNSGIERVGKQIAITNKLLQAIDPFLIPYRKGDKWGYCDRNKKIIIDCRYEYVNRFIGDLALVLLNHKYGYIDKTGKEIIPLIYESAANFSEGLARVKYGHYLYIDKNGRRISEYNGGMIGRYGYQSSSFLGGLAIVHNEMSHKCGFIDKTGKEIIPCIYDFAGDINHAYLPGETIYDHPLYEGLCRVRTNSGWGFIDKTGKEVISCIYENASRFSEGLAAIKLNDKWGYINKTGEQVIPCIYDKARPFSEGLAEVIINNKSDLLLIVLIVKHHVCYFSPNRNHYANFIL